MIEVLAAIGGVTSAGALVAVVVLAFKLVAAKDEQLAARDRIEKLDEEYDGMVRERDGLIVERDAARELLEKEKNLRAVAESQRNNAFQEARDALVERIKKSNVADAQRLVADLLATPLPGFVPQAVPAPKRSETGPDRLENPWMQPADDSGTGG